MKKKKLSNKSILKNDVRIFSEAIRSFNLPSPLSDVLYKHYTDEMMKAVNHGRICTSERMAILYPIFREINIEQEEIRAEHEQFEREAKQAAKKTEVKK